jgi:hypothetical protein
VPSYLPPNPPPDPLPTPTVEPIPTLLSEITADDARSEIENWRSEGLDTVPSSDKIDEYTKILAEHAASAHLNGPDAMEPYRHIAFMLHHYFFFMNLVNDERMQGYNTGDMLTVARWMTRQPAPLHSFLSVARPSLALPTEDQIQSILGEAAVAEAAVAKAMTEMSNGGGMFAELLDHAEGSYNVGAVPHTVRVAATVRTVNPKTQQRLRSIAWARHATSYHLLDAVEVA